ncbi:hypothetical protein skT53_00140 [Effusibacillus dendaii]|uniref:Uncharacterized protein n=1 Tax=Effusibacillus dendaii TaxID=2743772 RepID=A0A7I8D7P3_9BACL|nr:hypothetical protein skT53_00140 [Effusibacillus dendaii]
MSETMRNLPKVLLFNRDKPGCSDGSDDSYLYQKGVRCEVNETENRNVPNDIKNWNCAVFSWFSDNLPYLLFRSYTD